MDEPIRFDGDGPPPEAIRRGPVVPGRRVLVVDDDEPSAHGLALILRIEGYDVRVAHDGESALSIVRAFRPGAVLSDLGLPGIDGHELARRIRRDRDASANLELLAAVSGQGEAEVRRRSREAGFDCHIVKPVDPAAILALLGAIAWREGPVVAGAVRPS